VSSLINSSVAKEGIAINRAMRKERRRIFNKGDNVQIEGRAAFGASLSNVKLGQSRTTK
jgi:hypothetical protein